MISASPSCRGRVGQPSMAAVQNCILSLSLVGPRCPLNFALTGTTTAPIPSPRRAKIAIVLGSSSTETLVGPHPGIGVARPPSQSRYPLDDRRMRRVIDYVEQHLTNYIAVADLAKVACPSVFRFTRAFFAASSMPPHRYVSQRRLDYAKEMIATGACVDCRDGFDVRISSQSSCHPCVPAGDQHDARHVSTPRGHRLR